jgi:Ca2+-binding RTX toxin-like protein
VTARRRLVLLGIALAAFLAAPGTALAVQARYLPAQGGGTDLFISDGTAAANSVTIENGTTPGLIEHLITDTTGVTSGSPACVVETPTRLRCSISESSPPPSGVFSQIFVSLGAGNDRLEMSTLRPARLGATRTTTVGGGQGNDVISAATGGDSVLGGRGRDLLIGNGGGDSMDGEGGDDRLLGGLGDDFLRGGPGNDRLFGQQGREHLNGSKGRRDRCVGGPGSEHVIDCERGDPNN